VDRWGGDSTEGKVRLPQTRVANLSAAIGLPAALFVVITFVVLLAGEWWPDSTSALAARVNRAFDLLGVAIFVACLASGFAFLWRAFGRWALLAALVYVPAMFVTVLYIGLFIAGAFFDRSD
jgi:hypothetical protein